jgi:DNA-binding CsgD family transcriptional regulator
MHRFDTTLCELAAMADALTDAPDLDTVRALLARELGSLADAAGAAGAQMLLHSGVDADEVLTFTTPGVRPDVDRLVVGLARSEPWSCRIVAGRVTVVDRTDDDHVMQLFDSLGLTQIWVVGGARSLHPLNCAVFAFTGHAPVLPTVSATALSIHCTLLMSRAMSRLTRFEWDDVASSPARESYAFATDTKGMLVRWPFPMVGADSHIAEQVIPRDRRPLFAAVDALLSGGNDSYSLVVRAAALPESTATVRLLARRSAAGGVEGIVLPPSHPIQMLPQRLASLLSPREREVAGLLASGLRVRQITQQLFVSENTVRNHLKSIFAKLGITSQAELLDEIARADPLGEGHLVG